MSGETHRWIGTAVLVINLAVGVWALLAARRAGAPPRALTWGVIAGLVVLGLQILIGLDLWARGARPASAAMSLIHLASPILALAGGAALILGREDARRHAAAAFLVLALALVSYGIGEMGA
jgi:hypothetical protein